MTITFKVDSTPLPEALVASIVLDKIIGPTPSELVAMGYGELTVDDIGRMAWLCGRNVEVGLRGYTA